jgi:midasin
VANVHGVLLLKSTSRAPMTDSLIHTPTAIKVLQSLAAYYSLRYPTLLSSPPSSGKSSYLYHLAAVLHPEVHHQIISLHLSDTSLDPRSLLGSYISSPTTPGTFEWREGALVKAMKEGKWVVLADIDRASSEVLGVLSPLVGSLDAGRYVGGRALINVPGRGTVKAHPAFALFATRTIRADSTVAKPTFLGAHRFAEVIVGAPASEELRAILDARVPRLAGSPVLALVNMWQAIRALGSNASLPEIGLRQLEQFCVRVDAVIPSSYRPMDLDEELEIVKLSSVFRNPTVCENILLEARDVFFGAGAPNAAAKAHLDTVVAVIGDHLGLEAERRDTVLYQRAAEVRVDKDGKGRIRVVHAGRVTLAAKETQGLAPPQTRPFAMHRPVANLIARITSAVALAEPVLLAGETGTGKTSAVAHLATLLARPLTALNMSHQTEAADLVGGFRPVDARVPGGLMQERFIELFSKSFSRKKNAKFEEATRKAVSETNWKRACVLWKEAGKLAREKLSSKAEERFTHLLST